MAKADWTQQIWYSFPDPTGMLDSIVVGQRTVAGKVCKMISPTSGFWSDSLKYEIGSDPQALWSQTDYLVTYQYAWKGGAMTVPRMQVADEIYIWSRTSGATYIGTNYLFTGGYRAKMVAGADNAATLTLERIVGGAATSLGTTTITSGANATWFKPGTRHTYTLSASGGASNVALVVQIDGVEWLNINDTHEAAITTGAPAMGIKSGGVSGGGAVFVDNFEVRKLTVEAGPEAWLPTLVTGLSFWTKATDGYTKTGSNAVSEWADQSGNSNNAGQANLTLAPTWTGNAINSMPVMDFDGVDNTMAAADAATLDLTAMSVLGVVKADTFGGASGENFTSDFVSKGTNFAVGIINSASTGSGQMIFTAGGENEESSSDVFATGSDTIICCIAKVGEANGAFFINGTTSGTVTQTVGGVNSTAMSLGTDGARFYNGEIAELLVYSTKLSDADRAKVEGYLAWRYGLVANLPALHPYKTAPPTP